MLIFQVFIVTIISLLVVALINRKLKGKLVEIFLEAVILTVPIYVLLLVIKALEKYVGV